MDGPDPGSAQGSGCITEGVFTLTSCFFIAQVSYTHTHRFLCACQVRPDNLKKLFIKETNCDESIIEIIVN